MGRSAADHQRNVREFHVVWRVVTLIIVSLSVGAEFLDFMSI